MTIIRLIVGSWIFIYKEYDSEIGSINLVVDVALLFHCNCIFLAVKMVQTRCFDVFLARNRFFDCISSGALMTVSLRLPVN